MRKERAAKIAPLTAARDAGVIFMKVRKYSEIVFLYLAISTFFALLALVILYPWHPVTLVGGFFWLLTVLPIWVIGEGIMSVFVNDRTGKFINKNTSKTSVGRIGYGVLVLCLLILIFGFFSSAVGDEFDGFFEENFSEIW